VNDAFVDVDGDVTGQYGQIDTISLRAPQAAAPGVPSDVPPGDYTVHLRFEEGTLDPRPLPVEIWVQALDPGEAPGAQSAPGPPPEPARTPSPTPTPSAAPRDDGADDGGDGGVLVAAGAGGLLAGLFGGMFARRGRRR
jgi:hypothetical protein